MSSAAEDPSDRELRGLTGQFATAFADDPQLAYLTDAARRVLAVAAALFFQRGSAATSVRELTRACGLTPGALYNHFGSREELLYTLVNNGHARTEQRLDQARAAAVAAGADAAETLTRFVTAYTDVHLRFPAFAQLVHREYLHLSDDRRAEIVLRRRGIRDQLVGIVRDGVRSGRFTLVGGAHAETATAMMILDMCSRTSEWYNSSRPSARFSERYAAAALRLVGATPGARVANAETATSGAATSVTAGSLQPDLS